MLFGLPVEAVRAAAAAGDLVLLGCFEPEEPQHYRCDRGHDWRVADEGLWQADVVAALTRHGYRDDGDDDA